MNRDTPYTIFSLFYVLTILYFAIRPFTTRAQLILLFLPLSFVLVLIKPRRKLYPMPDKVERIILFVLVIILILIGIYFFTQYHSLIYERKGAYSLTDYVLGAVLIILSIELTRKEYGLVIPVFTIAFILYAYFGWLFPGFLHHAGLPIHRVVSIASLEFGTGSGVLGTLPQIGISWIAIFLIFAGIARGFGALEHIIKGAYLLVRKFRSSLPQVSVLGSMFFGMFSGSGAANAAAVGSFTIPLMKRYNISARVAAAIEAIAGSGGQIMPPIMGAAAFLMADYLGMYYWDIALRGFIPAFIYYASVALAVYLSTRGVIKPFSEANSDFEKITGRSVLTALLPFIIGLITLIIAMGYFMLDIMLAGFLLTLSFLLTWLIQRIVTSKNRREVLKEFTRNFIDGVKAGAETTASIVTMLACIGIIVGVLTTTGLAQKISFAMVDISGGNLIILVIMAAIVCLIFGMAVTTVAAYVLTVTLAAPALQALGVPPILTHFSVFYFGMIGLITPPVAPSCLVASGIAKSGFLETCKEAIKMGAALIILPFTFYAHPELFELSLATLYDALIIGLGMGNVVLGLNLPYKGLKYYAIRAMYFLIGMVTMFYPDITIASVLAIICALLLLVTLFKFVKRQ